MIRIAFFALIIDEILLMTIEVIGFEAYGTAVDIAIGLHQFPTVDIHHLRIIKMRQHGEIEISCALLHAQQDIVDTLHGAFQRLGSILQRFFLHDFP